MDEIQNTESVTSDPTDTSSESSFDASFEKVYNEGPPSEAASLSDGSAPEQLTPEQHYAQVNSTLDGFVEAAALLPDETKAYLRKAIDGTPMPQSWGQDKAEIWNQMNRHAQEYIVQRELEAQRAITAKGQELAELRQLAEQPRGGDGDFAAAFESYRAQGLVPRHNDGREVTAGEIVQEALAIDQALRSNPEQVIAMLAQAHGVNLGSFGHDPQATAQREQQIAQHAWQSAQTQVAQRQQAEQMARLSSVNALVARFAEGKDYLPQLENEIANQIELIKMNDPNRVMNDPVGTLKEAHDRAIKATDFELPETKLERMRKAADAKRLASLNVRSSAGRSPRTISKDIWASESWGDIYDQVASR
jgi:hypothetical protein